MTRQQGELLLKSGGAVEAAEAAFRGALEIARAQGARLFELKAAVSISRLWASQGRGREATALLQAILSTFDDSFNFPDLRDARMFLELPTNGSMSRSA